MASPKLVPVARRVLEEIPVRLVAVILNRHGTVPRYSRHGFHSIHAVHSPWIW